MKILDVHVHLGDDCVFDDIQPEEEILEYHRPCGVTGGIIQPLIPRPYKGDTIAIHDRIKRFCDNNPGYYGMASIEPHLRPEDYDYLAKYCIEGLGFKGIKITPYGHGCNPESADAYHVYEVAGKLGVPVMIHTGNGFPFADVTKLEKPLADFPDLDFVIAHCNLDSGIFKTISVCQRFKNAWCEPSWCSVTHLTFLKNAVGAERILFSADLVTETARQLTTFKQVFSTEEEQELVFHKNAEKVFKLS